jgi:hypothetical protein
MSGTVWTKFYWSDWESDPALRLCSLAAQGLWMRMLCIAASHDPVGYVAVAGKGLDETALARLTGCSESEVASLLGELTKHGVFSRDRHGRIYSRRMVRDARKSSEARKNGRLGGNPSLRNSKGIRKVDNPQDKGGLKPQEPEARSHEEKAIGFSNKNPRTKPPNKRLSYPPQFEEFWMLYPTDQLMSKSKTYTAWSRLNDEDRDKAAKAVPRFKTYCREYPAYRPCHATTFINERRFDGLLEKPALAAAAGRWGDVPEVIEPARDDFWAVTSSKHL